MRSVLSRFSSRFLAEEVAPTGTAARLDKVVARHQTDRAAATQKKLSVQVSDPPPEEVTTPLYDMSVYISPPGES